MEKVNFYEKISDDRLKFAVIVSQYDRKWLWCRHSKRSTYEIPGGHRETGESIENAAKRELYEETGAVDFTLEPICAYGVEKDGTETCGMLYFAEIFGKENELHSEIAENVLFDGIPEKLTYPHIQPLLFEKASLWMTGGLTFSRMQNMQRSLQRRYIDKWGGLSPEKAAEKLLWMYGELGEAADIIKKRGYEKIMSDKAVRQDFIEEICDSLMYLNDILICFDISPEEIERIYLHKYNKNMGRW